MGREVVAEQRPARRAVEVEGGRREQVGHRVRLGGQVEVVLGRNEDDPHGLRGRQALPDELLHGAEAGDVERAVATVTAGGRPAGAEPVATLPGSQGRGGQSGQPRHLGDGERDRLLAAGHRHALILAPR